MTSAVRLQPGWQQWWWIYLLANGVAILLYQLTPAGLGQDLIYQVIGFAGVVAIVIGVRRFRPARPLAWYLMAAGQLLWSIADAVFSWDATIQHNDRFPSPADPFYLAAYPVIVVGLSLLIRARRPRRDLAGFLDSAVVLVALALLSWVLLAKPILTSSHESALAAAVAVAYPIGDILLIAPLIRLITTPGGHNTSLRLLVTAMLLLIVVDTAASALDLLTFDSTDAINFLWLASYATWGAAALHPSMVDLSQPAPIDVAVSRKRLTALTVAVLVAPGVLLAQYLLGLPIDVIAIVIGSVLMFVLVVSRMALAIEQIFAANKQRAQAQEALAHQAAHDALTGLPNRRQASELITAALSRSSRTGGGVGLLFIDLDGFKTVNDTFGHAAGDELLRIVASRMQANVRIGDVVARLGGDEFIVLLEPLDNPASAVGVADRLIAAISEPITVAGNHEVTVGASIGVSVSQRGDADPEALLHEADVAVYRAKHSGKGRTEFFDPTWRREDQARTELQLALTSAVATDELVLHYQPIVHLPSGEVHGYEALVRWHRPGIGLVSPADFIPVAEQSELICDLDTWVLRRAAHQVAAWNERTGGRGVVVAVNISGRHVARTRVLEDVASAVDAAGIEPDQLVLEITETALIDGPLAASNLDQLRRRGHAISIDDFGSGYTSIARLEELPADLIKVDRRFVDRTAKSADKLLRLIVQTAHSLDLAVIAEGVEDAAQLNRLKALRCEYAQGYYFGRPVEPEAIQPTTATSPSALSRSTTVPS